MAFQAPDPTAMGGAPPLGGAPDPEALLAQIRDLLDQYLAMGADTPVAQEAQTLADAIDQNIGGGAGDMGAPPPDAGAEPVVPPEKQPGGLADMAEPPPSDSKTYAGANVNALDRLKKRNKRDQG